MNPRKITYDVRCFQLAEHFIADKPLGTDEHLDALAQHIQSSIEDWIAATEEHLDQ